MSIDDQEFERLAAERGYQRTQEPRQESGGGTPEIDYDRLAEKVAARVKPQEKRAPATFRDMLEYGYTGQPGEGPPPPRIDPDGRHKKVTGPAALGEINVFTLTKEEVAQLGPEGVKAAYARQLERSNQKAGRPKIPRVLREMKAGGR